MIKLLALSTTSLLKPSYNRCFSTAISKCQVPKQNASAEDSDDKGFVNLPTPFQLEPRSCILCKHKIPVDYKNPRLLSQFVSPFTGEVYDKHITGLCEFQQTLVEREIKKSRKVKLMPYLYRDPKFNNDPPLFNPFKPQRPNPY